MDITIIKKKFTKSRIIIAAGPFTLIIFIVFIVPSFGRGYKLNAEVEKVTENI